MPKIAGYIFQIEYKIQKVASPNTNYTLYVEIIINLRKDAKINNNKIFIVRSEYKRVLTPSTHANNVAFIEESNQIDPTSSNSTSVTINWGPPKVLTGVLEKFILLYRISLDRELKNHDIFRKNIYKSSDFLKKIINMCL